MQLNSLRYFGLPRPDPRDRKVCPHVLLDPAVWLVMILIAIEAALLTSGGFLRHAVIQSYSLIPDRTFGLPDFSGFPLTLWLSQCATSTTSELCAALSAWPAEAARAEIWRSITYIFVHTDPVHLAANAVALVLFAPAVLARSGTWRFVLLFVASGIAGALALLLVRYVPEILWLRSGGAASESWFPGLTGSQPVIGASGAVFGIWLAAQRLEWDRLRRLPTVLQEVAPLRILAIAAFWAIGLNLIVMALDLQVSSEVHIGGALFGFLAAPFFQRPAFHAARRRVASDLRARQE